MNSPKIKRRKSALVVIVGASLFTTPLTALAQRNRNPGASGRRLARYTIKGNYTDKLDETENDTVTQGEFSLRWEISETIAITPPDQEQPLGGFVGVENGGNKAAQGSFSYKYDSTNKQIDSHISLSGDVNKDETGINLPSYGKFHKTGSAYVGVDFGFSAKGKGHCSTTSRDAHNTTTLNMCSGSWAPFLDGFKENSDPARSKDDDSIANMRFQATLNPKLPADLSSTDAAEQASIEADRMMATGTETTFAYELFGATTQGNMQNGFTVTFSKSGKTASGSDARLQVTAQIVPGGTTVLLDNTPGPDLKEVGDRRRATT